jgi:hypothetical protein
MVERVKLIDAVELVDINSGGKMNGVFLVLLKAVLPYDFSRLLGKMLGQIDNEQSFVLVEDLDNRVESQ